MKAKRDEHTTKRMAGDRPAHLNYLEANALRPGD